ncbi:hypothetical protein QR685DRAFT_568772 [Neurospora intermedia]|uniref:Uncharacterized protein n=1 Tax=Neurospora intermedia TaxID=5142 RepID=A0ABR3DTW8_NEUIN
MKVVSTQLLFAVGGEKFRSTGQIGPTLARLSVYPETPTKESSSSSSPSIAHEVTIEGLLQREDSRCLERESADWSIASDFCSDASTGAERGRVHRPSPSASKPAYPVLTSSVQVTTPGRLTSVTPFLRQLPLPLPTYTSHLPCLCSGTTDHGLELHVSSITPKHRKSGFMFFFDRTLSPLVPVCPRPLRECVQHVYQIAALRSLRLRLLSCCWPRQ